MEEQDEADDTCSDTETSDDSETDSDDSDSLASRKRKDRETYGAGSSKHRRSKKSKPKQGSPLLETEATLKPDEENFPKTTNRGGLGNLAHLQEFFKIHGAILEEDCKCKTPIFEGKSKTKGKMNTPVPCTDKVQPKRKFRVQDLIILDKVDEEQLIRLVDEGPVAVVIDVSPTFEKFRGRGIYKGSEKDAKKLDKHMLLLTGYGTYKNEHYWKCQNSAGVGWGDSGFVKIVRQVSRDKGQPSLIKCILYPVLLDREAYNP